MAIDIYKLENGFKIFDDVTKEEYFFDGDFIDLLSKIDKKKGLNIYLPAQNFFIRKANLPKLEREKTKDILTYEMEDKFIEPSKNLQMDFISLEETEKDISALVFAIERDNIERYIKSFGKELSFLKSINVYFDESLSNFLSQESFDNSNMNFIPKEYLGLGERYGKIELLKRGFFYLNLIFFIFLLGEGVKFFILNNKEIGLKRELLSASQMLSQGQKVEGDPMSYIQAKMIDLKNNYKILKGIDVLETLKNISKNIQGEIKIKEIKGEGTIITLKGDCKDMASLQQFKTNLLKDFKDTKILETKNLPDSTINFTMELELNDI